MLAKNRILLPHTWTAMDKRILFIFFLLLTCTRALSAVFVVTSNADSGPGTLREALTQAAANGIATTDYINFNLADPTITLLSALPAVSSNLVIDGSTQPGAAIGVNGGKVTLYAGISGGSNFQSFFDISDQANIEIDGFIFDILPALVNSGYGTPVGIYSFENSQNVVIGAPGKGNVFYNINLALMFGDAIGGSTILSGNIKISSNIFGLDATGQIFSNLALVAIDAFRVANLTLGGTTAAERNIFCSQVNVDEQFSGFSESTGSLLVYNNFFGTDFTGTKAIPNYQAGSTLLLSAYNRTQLEISNNVFAAQSDIGLSPVNCFFKITGNKFGIDVTGTKVLGTFQFPIDIGYCQGGGIIGGSNPADGNIFAGAYTDPRITSPIDEGVIINVATPGIELANNSFRCNNSTLPYSLQGADFSKYFVTVSGRTANAVSGTATASSRVDLYYSISCDHCEPEREFASVNADAAGNWTYNGALLNYNIIAASTSNGTTSEFTVLRFTNQPTDVVITAACNGQSNGSIKGITTSSSATYMWYDSNGNKVAQTKDLLNVPAGKYSVTISDGYCATTSSGFTVPGVTTQADISKMNISAPTCGGQNGSVTGIIIDPSLVVQWSDQSGNIRSTSADLVSVGPGSYLLTVATPNQSCTKTYGPYKLSDVGSIILDESKVQITLASCSMDNGSITGMQITGNAQYKWVDANNKIVTTTVDLKNAAPGDYTFTAYNQLGCSQTSKSYHIGTLPPTRFPAYNSTMTASCFNTNNGSINITTDALVKSVRWVNSQGVTVGNTAGLSNISAGVYGLYLTDQNSCETFYNNFTVDEISPIQILQSSAQIVNDECTLSIGSIKGIEIAGGQLPYNYTWTNASGNVIASTPDIAGLSADEYTLTVKDVRGCNLASDKYTIQDIENILSAPSVDNIQICTPGDAFLIVNDPVNGNTYRLYDNESDQTPIDSQPLGKFQINAQANRKYYVSVASGSCESPRTEVDVTVGIAGVNIPNTITPNGDGINDYWNIKGLQDYTNCVVQIFTRYGQKVFESKGYAHPFDGTFGGKSLPSGVYYYVINLNTNCSLLSGNLTIIR
ncbi:MAG: gliding motility-associated C-terminal domain-containing protein [Sphingobacteriales bacterium]